MITLHQYHQSPFNQKIQRMLYYKGIPFREQYWGLTDGRKVKQFNPTGKLPARELIEKYPNVPRWMERLGKATGQRAPSEDNNHE